MAILFALLALLLVPVDCLAIFVLRYNSNLPAGKRIAVEANFPPDLQINSLLVRADNINIPYKLERTGQRSRLSWISNGAATYFISYDTGTGNGVGAGLMPELDVPVAPAMIGAGDRVMFGRAHVRGKLAVGLWAHPAPIDFDEDGDIDLIVGCPDKPFNGTFLFRNVGGTGGPLFDRGEWIGPGKKDLVAADLNGDGELDLVTPGGYYSDVRANRMNKWVMVPLAKNYHVGRDELWYPVDWDKDGLTDLLVGASDWREYGWDDAFDAKGAWTRGPLHGFVWFHKNIGTAQQPRFATAVPVNAGGKPIDLYGSPSPNPVDWFGKGKLDLIGGDFLDTITLFRAVDGGLAPGEKIQAGGATYHADLCMIQPRVVNWHGDGRPSLIVGEEDGTIAFLENVAPRPKAPELAAPRYFEQLDPYVKSGALSRPVAVDWNGDGKLDIVTGNSAGYIQYFENVGTKTDAAFEDRGYFQVAGKPIRRMAGPNGSIQGPAEAKWGYANPWVVDWDLDGKLDILMNDIWGSVHWYRNLGGAGAETKFAPLANIEVEWEGPAPKPAWNWWNPEGKQLVTQWRTTPHAVDWNRDGLPDLVMLDHEGYLALFRRARKDGQLKLMPPERIFLDMTGKPLPLSRGRAGKSGRRKVQMIDWDGDGDLDLITDGDFGADWFENTGTQEKPVLVPRGLLNRTRIIAGHNPTPNAADWNGDGKLDLLIGGEDGFFYFFERSYLDGK